MKGKTFWFLFLVFLTVITGCGSGGSNDNGSSDGKQTLNRAYSFGVRSGITPSSMAVAKNGDVFMSFAHIRHLVKFTNFGKPNGGSPQVETVLDPAEYEKSGLANGTSIAVSPRDGNLYVQGIVRDAQGGHIAAFSPEGKFLFRFNYVADAQSGLKVPNDIVVDSTGRVYASAFSPSGDILIIVFDAKGNYLHSIHKASSQPFREKAALALDKDDNLFVGAGLNVTVFSPSGQFLRNIVINQIIGPYPGFNGPTAYVAGPLPFEHLVVDDRGNLYISSFYVTKYSAEGEPLTQVGPFGAYGLSLDADRNLYVLNAGQVSNYQTSVFTQR